MSVTFKTYVAPTYLVRNWVVPLSDNLEARLRLSNFAELLAKKLPRHCSADAYLYWDAKILRLGVTMFESSTTELAQRTHTPASTLKDAILGPEDNLKIVDGVELFESEMYMSGMHGGHGGGKTSSFKRCLFLKRIGTVEVANILVAAIEARPSSLCYLHLLQGGGAIGDVADDATAFGCRDWDFACVVTGVWPRDQDETRAARAAVQWVYNVAMQLMPLSSGAYGADLGPDHRDAALATKAFGPNLPRLASLKHTLDPDKVLAYACPFPAAPNGQKLIILVTGESCAGKDFCADVWVSVFSTWSSKSRRVRQRPQLPEEHFLKVVHDAVDVDILFITGIRDDAPVAALSHLVPGSRLLEVCVQASRGTRRARRGCRRDDDDDDNNQDTKDSKDSNDRPNLIFNNDTIGNEAAERFSKHYLLPYMDGELQRLARMVRLVHNFPRSGVDFRDVLGISQEPGGLGLCTSLLRTHFADDWAKADVVISCETGGFIYASALAVQANIPMALVREAGKLPPPTISVTKCPSHISSSASNSLREERVEMGRDVVPRGSSVVVVDDVLATGKTLCAVLKLLNEAGIGAEAVSVMVVAEFPVHRGRELLRRRGFGGAKIQSLLVFGGA
ncbi:hypothetical protein LTR56_026931 [Elasticomyces elasticus]|nr:hypothetical protein LTR56_026931 [Elasticomyces elasticus]KAK5747294.1 hypothetical protein LTS12_022444 [Elasticomyces elasticus]